MFQQTAEKKCWWKICDLWKRHGVVQSFLQGAGPKGIRLLICFVHFRQISTCMSHDAWCENCSNVFSKKKHLKTWKRNYCIFCPCDEETSRFWVKMAYLVRNFISFYLFRKLAVPPTKKYLKCSSLSNALFPDMRIFDRVCLRLLPFGQWECLLTGNKWVLVRHKQANNSISLKSVLEKALWNPERKQQYSWQHLEWKLHEWTLTVFQGTSHWNCKTYFEMKCLCQKHKTIFF